MYAPQRPPVEEGARIWKLYNHGFVVRTPSVTIAFDLVRGDAVRVKYFALDNNLMKRIIAQCDVLFISHYHRDHAEKWVAQTFIDQGKPVVAPPDVWKDQPIHSSITHLKREAHTLQSLPILDGKLNLDVVIYPGHQGSNIDCNVALVITPEGLSFSHTGDQSNNEDFEWIDEVANHHEVDVFIPNCWTTDIVRAIKGFDPAIVITRHENEMGHTIDHREPYWLTYQRKTGSDRFGGNREIGYDYPLIPMTWGESYHYIK